MSAPETIIQYSYPAAVLCLGLALLLSLAGKSRACTGSLSLFFLCMVLFFSARAYLKQFFPFTDKVESFATLVTLIPLCGLIYRNRIAAKEFSALLVLALLFAFVVFLFEDKLRYPTAYLRTIWYPLHVPLSFFAYAFWFLATVNSLFSLRILKGDSGERPLVTGMNRNGFILFSLAMLFGGIWGYLAWGAYFMWDSKLLWSVILWLYYGNLLHIDGLPRFRKWKVPLYLIGMILILITFIGTGFFSRSIHKF